MPFHKVIGIDLGTTYSAVSIWDGKEARMIDSPFGHNTVPSVVGLDPDGDVIVGTQAQNNLVNDPANTVIEVKREMGTYEVEPTGPGDPGLPRRIRFRDRDYLPQEISAFILRELKRMAENIVGEPIHDAVITVPAYFREPQRGATEDAARMARLNVRMLLNEPTAAAVCFGADQAEDDDTHTYAVYDLGGGTFDVSIVQVSRGNVSVVGTGGDSRLGGSDFDDRITDYALQWIRDKHGVDLTDDPAVRPRVKRAAEVAKRELSSANAAQLNLPFLTPTLSVNVPINRATFEKRIHDLLQRSLVCLDQAIESARESNGIERDDIEQVLLVGGSTLIACIRQLLAAQLDLDPKDVRADIKPQEVVARGAGMVAREYSPSDSFIGSDSQDGPGELVEDSPKASHGALVLQDVTSHTLGIAVNRTEMARILRKDSRIPIEVTQDHFINAGGSKWIDVMIFQGESERAWDNALIGRLPIELPEERERGYYKFAVTFALDVHGLLGVQVRCLNDDQIWKTDVQCSVRSTSAQIEQSSKHLDEVEAGGSDAAEEPDTRVVDESVPPPPGRLPPPPPRVAAPEPTPPPPPDDTPAEFRSTLRRVYKLLPQLEAPERTRLTAKYLEVLAAVRDDSPDLEDLHDDLYDLFRASRG